MTTELATVRNEIVNSAGDAKVIALFVNTKRSENTKVQYAHSIKLLFGFVGKSMADATMEDALAYHSHLQAQYESLHSIKLHINVAKALFAFALSINHIRTNVFAVIKPDTTP